jgi:hypothetical protein
VPITPFLRDEAFDPEAVEAMARAFLAACRALGLADRGDPLSEIVAKHLINREQLLSALRTWLHR